MPDVIQKVLVVLPQAYIKGVVDEINKKPNMEVAYATTDGADAIEFIKQNDNLKAVIFDLILPSADGFAVLDTINSSLVKPIAIAYTTLTSENAVKMLAEKNVAQLLIQPLSPKTVADRVWDFIESVSLPFEFKPSVSSREIRFGLNKSIEEKITEIFLQIGIPAHIRGYKYLKEGVMLVVSSPDYINCITKELYPAIGEKFDASASKVERSIRHAIDVAFSRGQIQNLNNLFGVKIYNGSVKPTNGEFIALIADKLMLESC